MIQGIQGRACATQAMGMGIAMSLTRISETRRRGINLMHTYKRARVRAYLIHGQRPHVNFFVVR